MNLMLRLRNLLGITPHFAPPPCWPVEPGSEPLALRGDNAAPLPAFVTGAKDDAQASWEAFALGNGHYLVPQASRRDSTVSCALAMCLHRGLTLAEAAHYVPRGHPAVERIAIELKPLVGHLPRQMRGVQHEQAGFRAFVNTLERRLRACGPGLLTNGDESWMLYDIRRTSQPGQWHGHALVGDPADASVHAVPFGPDGLTLVPRGPKQFTLRALFVTGSMQQHRMTPALAALSTMDATEYRRYLCGGYREHLGALRRRRDDFVRLCALMWDHLHSPRADAALRAAFLESVEAGDRLLGEPGVHPALGLTMWRPLVASVTRHWVEQDRGCIDKLALPRPLAAQLQLYAM